jgi:hypothetical protein
MGTFLRSKKSLLFIMLCVAFSSCASRKGADEKKILAPREASVVDPANPPMARIEGLSANELVTGEKVLILSIDNYPMEQDWQGMEVALNDLDPERFYQNRVEWKLPLDRLNKGANIVRIYPVRSWGESVKEPSAFAFVPFFYESKAGLSWVAPQRPILTLVSPRGTYQGEDAKKILFDFMVQNPEKTKQTYTVHYTLNGTKLKLNTGRAYHFYNLPEGDYELRVEVVNQREIPLGQEVTRSVSKFKIVGSGAPKSE